MRESIHHNQYDQLGELLAVNSLLSFVQIQPKFADKSILSAKTVTSLSFMFTDQGCLHFTAAREAKRLLDWLVMVITGRMDLHLNSYSRKAVTILGFSDTNGRS